MTHGFTHGEYLDTLNPGWIHVWTRPSLIAREGWRRLHAGEISIDRNTLKQAIRELITDHLKNRALCMKFRI